MITTVFSEPGLLLILGGLGVLLAVLVVGRHVANRHELRTVCLGCGATFQGFSEMNFAGFREMTCSACGAPGLYPMPKWMVIIYVTILIVLPAAVVVQAVTDPKWEFKLGGVWILALPVALVVNRGLWRRLRAAAAREPGNVALMERVGPAHHSAERSTAGDASE